MKKIAIALTACALCGTVSAQDIYKVENLSGNDLVGTSRYVGMGGAMSALGADISTMGTNPAAIGLYRRSDVALTGGVTVQPDATSFWDINKARGSWDQAGIVFSFKQNSGKLKYVNFGFNYQKRRNFKNYLSASDDLSGQGGMSQTWELRQMAGTLDLYDDGDRERTMPIALVGYDTQLLDPTFKQDEEGNEYVDGYNDCTAQDYNYRRVQWGGIQQYDFNVSFNVSDRFYGGVTLGVYNVNMHTGLYYDETLNLGTQGGQAVTDYYYMNREESLKGTGIDVKFGFIFRPIEDSPFRIGIAVSTPTFYDLTEESYVYMNSPFAYTSSDGSVEKYHPNARGDENFTEAGFNVGGNDYRIRTPWKIGLSMATTVGNYLALDAEYEVSRYTGASINYPDGDSYYGFGGRNKDHALNDQIDRWMQTVSTFRIGAEARLADGLYARAGYNFVTSPFKKDAYLDLFTESPSYYYRTNTDYVNLGEIHRVTLGLGYRGKIFYGDLSYQYQHQSADIYAFNYIENGDNVTNRLTPVKADLNRHNVMLTLGLKF